MYLYYRPSSSNTFVVPLYFISYPFINLYYLKNKLFVLVWTSILDIICILSTQHLFGCCHYRNCPFSSCCGVRGLHTNYPGWLGILLWRLIESLCPSLSYLAQKVFWDCSCWGRSCHHSERIYPSIKHKGWQSQESLKKMKILNDIFLSISKAF